MNAVSPPPTLPRRVAVAALAVLLLGCLLAVGPVVIAADPVVPPVSTTGNPPSCRVADVRAKYPSTKAWARTLLDWRWKVPRSYVPPRLVPVSRAGLGGGGSVRAEVIRDLRALAKAARAAGAPLGVESAYRSYGKQVSTFAYWVRRFGYRTALIGSARAGHSEHQLGTTLDFKTAGGGAPWSIRGYNWGLTRQGKWLAKNAWRYGFVLSYPSGKRSAVCYGYEPWHYRYFGKTVARAIHRSGLTTRTWLWRHAGPLPTPTPTPSPTPTPDPTPTPHPSSTPDPSPSPDPTDPAPPDASA